MVWYHPTREEQVRRIVAVAVALQVAVAHRLQVAVAVALQVLQARPSSGYRTQECSS